jgi:ubiquinone/menaquinone biosynthesis C-methylase UbiE
MKANTTSYVNDQYKDSSNLDIRIRLHEMYSTNPFDWHEWVFRQINFADNCRIIEFGCGSAALWAKNKARLGEGWHVTLTDFSDGMLEQAQSQLAGLPQFHFRRMDVQAPDAEDRTFDIAIANHMLYHVPNVDQAISSVAKVLAPGGTFYAATNGREHMADLYRLIEQYDAAIPFTRPMASAVFGLENGEAMLRRHFSHVKLLNYASDLSVPNVQDLLDFIYSLGPGPELKEELAARKQLDSFIAYLDSCKNAEGQIRIGKHSGLFVCRIN